jgi:hypothetical protein
MDASGRNPGCGETMRLTVDLTAEAQRTQAETGAMSEVSRGEVGIGPRTALGHGQDTGRPCVAPLCPLCLYVEDL